MVDVNHLLRERKKLHNQLLISPALCFLLWLNLPKYWYRLIAKKKNPCEMGMNVPDLAMGWKQFKSSKTGRRAQEERWSHLAVYECHCIAAETETFRETGTGCSCFGWEPHSEQLQDTWTKSLPNMGPELRISVVRDCFPVWSKRLNLAAFWDMLETKNRLTQFIKKADCSHLSCLKRWRVFGGASYLSVGMIV